MRPRGQLTYANGVVGAITVERSSNFSVTEGATVGIAVTCPAATKVSWALCAQT